MVELWETVRVATVDWIAMGIITEFCVDVARRVCLASSVDPVGVPTSGVVMKSFGP